MPHSTDIHTLSPASHWILNKYITLTQDLETHTTQFELAHAVTALYEFLWDNYADWYVEYLKTDTNQIPFAKALFREFIITASPYIPFETETLWKEYYGETELLAHHLRSENFVNTYSAMLDMDKIKEFETIITCITSIRSARGLFNIDPATPLEINSTSTLLTHYTEFVTKAGRATVLSDQNHTTHVYSVTCDEITYTIDIARYITDKSEQIERTQKNINDLIKQQEALKKQLANEDFLNNAETEVIEHKQAQLDARTLEIKEQSIKLEFLQNA